MVEASEMLISPAFGHLEREKTVSRFNGNVADSEEVVSRLEETRDAKAKFVSSRESVAHHTFIVVGIATHDRCTTHGTGA